MSTSNRTDADLLRGSTKPFSGTGSRRKNHFSGGGLLTLDFRTLEKAPWFLDPRDPRDLMSDVDKMAQNFARNVKEVYVNEKKRTVAIKWADESVTKGTCSVEDEFDVYVGAAIAVAAHEAGSKKNFKRLIDRKTKNTQK